MKKFINRPEDVVEEMLQGLLLLNPGSARLAGHKVIVFANPDSLRHRQVAVLSGGGSGHEPAHAGYVGAGMLSAAILGEVFTSPSSDSVFAAIQAVVGKHGALLVVKNYTGDRLNFGLAAEMARAEGIAVEVVIVDDDVALRAAAPAAGARGLAGTILIHKLLGAAAAEGKSLTQLAAIGRAAVASLATMGVSLSAGTSPMVGKPSFELADHEMELGLGIHGEPGAKRTDLQPANLLVETLLSEILNHGQFGEGKHVAVMVNNLGATTEMELAIVARHTVFLLEEKGFTVERIYAGTFLSSLDMAGLSISVLRVTDEWLGWLDADTDAPAWPNAPKQRPVNASVTSASTPTQNANPATSPRAGSAIAQATKRAIEAACQALIAHEPELTELDRLTGDGDLGTSMERAAKFILTDIGSFPLDDIPATLKALGHTLRRELGGSSGPLYGVLLLRCGTILESAPPTTERWVEAIQQGCRAICELGGARPGDRTMVDALNPFARMLTKSLGHGTNEDALRAALEAADQGVEASAQMKPRLGRSSYLGDRVIGHPDPGARAVAVWLRAVVEALFREQL